MSGKIHIQYEAVYSKVAELQSCIDAELSEMEGEYRQVQSCLQGMDGQTNAAFMEAMEANRAKAKVTAETLHKLLSFMELSARQVEYDEMVLKGTFALGSGQESGLETEPEAGAKTPPKGGPQ